MCIFSFKGPLEYGCWYIPVVLVLKIKDVKAEGPQPEVNLSDTDTCANITLS